MKMTTKQKILWITETAVLIALLVVLQTVTASAGQLVTGSCVNLVLAVAVLVGGVWCGVTVAVLSPFFAFLVGVGPALFVLVPFIAVGNVVYTLILHFIAGKSAGEYKSLLRSIVGLIVAAFAKMGTLWLLIVVLMLPLLGLPDAKVSAMSAMFTWPQLFTALLGGAVALAIVPLLKKALHARN